MTQYDKEFWGDDGADTTNEAAVVSREGRNMIDTINVSGRKENVSENQRGRVLLKAVEIINGERQDTYGNPEDTFEEIAWVWNWWLGDHLQANLTAKDVAMMMALMKIAREKNGAGKTDNVVDACGYLGLYEDMRGAE